MCHGEYDIKTFPLVITDRGTSYRTSPLHAYHLNWVAKRIIQTITEKARSMMIDCQVPLFFLGEVVNTAGYFHQRTTKEGLTNRDDCDGYQAEYPTPYEMLQAFGKSSNRNDGNGISYKLLSSTFGDSAATPVNLSMTHKAMHNSALDPSQV